MAHAPHQPAATHLRERWRTRQSALEQSLADDPSAEWAWLWRARLRICTYLVRRYVDDAPRASVEPPAAITPRPESPAPFDAVKPRITELPADQLLCRRSARVRFGDVLERRQDVGEHVMARAAMTAEIEARRDRRSDRISMAIAYAVAAILFVPAFGSVVWLTAMGMSVFCRANPYLAWSSSLLFASFVALVTSLIAWWRGSMIAARRASEPRGQSPNDT